MNLKSPIMASRLSQIQADAIVTGGHQYLAQHGQFDLGSSSVFKAFFPTAQVQEKFDWRLLNGCQELYISVLIHLSLLTLGYGIDVSRVISIQAQQLGLSVRDLKSIESKVFNDLFWKLSCVKSFEYEQ